MITKEERLKLKQLESVKAELVKHYNLTEVEQYYLFSNLEGGTAEDKLLKILECRLSYYQLLTKDKDKQ